MTTEEAIADAVRALPPAQQQEVLNFVESLLREAQGDGLTAHQAGAYDRASDPLGPFLGAFEATEPDVVRRHDAYLADAYADTHEPEY